jgi:hypothetical protein
MARGAWQKGYRIGETKIDSSRAQYQTYAKPAAPSFVQVT